MITQLSPVFPIIALSPEFGVHHQPPPSIATELIPREIHLEDFDEAPQKFEHLSLPQLEDYCSKCNEALLIDIETAIESGEWAALRAFLLGRALVQAKKLVAHGKWEKWIDSHLPRTSIETARRYMQLAKGDRSFVLNGKGLCSAYRASGILPAPPHPIHIKRTPSAPRVARQQNVYRHGNRRWNR